MDPGTFIVRLVEALAPLAWPVVFVAAFLSVRGQVGGLLDRVQRLKWKDAEAAFNEGLNKLEEKAPLPPALEAPEQIKERAAAAQLPPAYIVQRAWLRLEGAWAEFNSSPTRTELAEQVYELRRLRNAGLDPGSPPTITDALRYKDQAEAVARRIEETGKTLANKQGRD